MILKSALNVAIVDGLKLLPSRKLSTETSDMMLHSTSGFLLHMQKRQIRVNCALIRRIIKY